MNIDIANAEDQLLTNNLKRIESDTFYLLDNEDKRETEHAACNESSGVNVLKELSCRFNDITLDGNEPQQPQTEAMQKYLPEVNVGGAKKKSKSTALTSSQNEFSRHMQNQRQKENIIKEEERGLLAIALNGDCIKRNPIVRLMAIFKSFHKHINTELPSNQINSLPSDYKFDLPKKSTLPRGSNVRHHVQVLCTKLERFLQRQRRILETNRNFDYTRYTECHKLLNNVGNNLRVLKEFCILELRPRAPQLTAKVTFDNAGKLETMLLELLAHLKAVHIHMFIFNWEMDLEYRCSSAMKATIQETNKRALELIAAEYQVPKEFDSTEQKMAEQYQLGYLISCAKQHEDFLTALLQSPEKYFQPNIVSLFEPTKIFRNLQPNLNYNVCERVEPLDFVGEHLPISPPRVNRRRHVPRINRA